MQLLYDLEKKTIDEYRYKINEGGELNIRSSDTGICSVTITFVNGKLESVNHNMGNFDLRSKWYICGAIAEKIKELESRYVSK